MDPHSNRACRFVRDERGFVTSFFIRTTIAFAIVAVAVNEVGQILVTTVHAHNGRRRGRPGGGRLVPALQELPLAPDPAVQRRRTRPHAKVLKLTST